jgi:hypothetical protein
MKRVIALKMSVRGERNSEEPVCQYVSIRLLLYNLITIVVFS